MKKLLGLILLCVLYSSTNSQSIITGKILGCNGRPMPMAHIFINGGMGHYQPFPQLKDISYAQAVVNDEGNFTISTTELGSLNLVFTGVGHQLLQIPLILEQLTTIELTVQLQQINYFQDFSNVEVRYNFQDGALGSSIIKMKKQSDGTYVAEIKTDKNQFAYLLRNVGKSNDARGIHGTLSDTYEYLSEGNYASIIYSRDGVAKIVFDPSKIVRNNSPENVTFSDTSSVHARFFTLYQQSLKNTQAYKTLQKQYLLSGKSFKTFSYNWSPAIKALKEKLAVEHNPILRHELILQYLELFGLSPTKIDTVFARKLLKEVPPTSSVWVYHGTLAFETKKYHPAGEKFFKKIIAQHPSRSFKATLLYWACVYAQAEKNVKAYTISFYDLVNKFGDTPAGKLGKRILHPKDKIVLGATIPDFSFVSLDDPKKEFTNQSFAGKYLLIDFWGTWCGPCIAEMGNLHKVYEKFKEKHFEILSIAGYDSPERVQRFRATKWKMPWSNVLIEPGKEPDIVLAFEVGAFPRPILISPTGKILALEKDLRGDDLERTLEKYLNGNN